MLISNNDHYRSKWQRLRAAVAKEGPLGDGNPPATPGKRGRPKKAAATEGEEEAESPKSGTKRKARGATSKGKKAKVMADAEAEDKVEAGEIKDEHVSEDEVEDDV
jgi:hypothetical protein